MVVGISQQEIESLNDIDIDPEGGTDGGNNNYPNIRIYNFGVNISF